MRYDNVNLVPVPSEPVAMELMADCLDDHHGCVSAQQMHDILEEWVMDAMTSENYDDAIVDDLFFCLSWIHENAPFKNDVLCTVHYIFL